MFICNRNKERILFIITILLILFYLISYRFKSKSKNMESMIVQSRNCLIIKKMPQIKLKNIWPILPSIVEECSGEIYNKLIVQKFNGFGEFKYFIAPILNGIFECDVMTLGIGGETAAEEEMFKAYPQCKFFGIDSGAKNSEYLYKTKINGTYLEGLVGAENGTYKANVLNSDIEHGYVEKILPHFSFHHLTKKFYKKDVIDLLLMDIEGDEFALMKELIDNPQKYPTICQINVEFHDPYSQKENVMEIFEKAAINGPYLIIKTEYTFTFNRAFFINFESSFCAKKYFSHYI